MAFTGLGAGTVGDPYQITTWNQFKEISTNLAANFKVMNDIDAAGNLMPNYNTIIFTGVLDCQNFRLSNMVTFFSMTGATLKNAKIDLSASVNYNIFWNISGVTILNVNVEFKTAISTPFMQSLVNSTVTNLKIFSPAMLVICYYGGGFSGNTLTDCTFQSSIQVRYEGMFSTSTFNNVNFISTSRDRRSLYNYKTSNCTFNNCLFYGDWYNQGNTSGVTRNYFNYCTFFTNVLENKTGVMSGYNGVFTTPGLIGTFNKCYFTGTATFNHTSYTEPGSWTYYPFYLVSDASLADCYFDYKLITTWDVPSTKCMHAILCYSIGSGTIVRTFFNVNISGFTINGYDSPTGTNVFVNKDTIIPTFTKLGNYTGLTTAQTKAAANFTNFDFTNVWQITEGTTAPTLRNVIYSESDYLLGAVLNSISVARDSAHIEKLSINTARALPSGSSLLVYCSTDLATLVNPANLVSTTVVSSSLITADLPVNEGTFYTKVVYQKDDYIQEFSANDFHYEAAQPATTIINIVAPNYITPTDLAYLHGSVFYNGYFYGSARGTWNGTDGGQSMIKLKADDYTIYTIKKLYSNKTASTGAYSGLEQIVFCGGFLWALSNGYLIRINPGDLDYMVFDRLGVTGNAQPIGTDGTNLFLTTDTAVYKVNSTLLLDTFAAYSYTGAAPVAIPPASILGNCAVIQYHPTIKAYLHSIIADSQFLYLAITTSYSNGYTDEIYFLHLQKIDKITMITAGDVIIPKCTDDMVQNTDYLFLAPEYANVAPDIFGSEYGLIAIKKSTLELKYLKALHKDFNTVNELDRQCYGVFYFNNRIIVQLVNSKKSVVVNTENVENWGSDFPIGGATEAVYSFQKNGVAVAYPPNELVLDNNNWVHISTWGTPGDIMKFPLSSMPNILKTPVIQTTLIRTNATGATVGGYIFDEGQSPITAGGFNWGTDPENLENNLPVTPFIYDFQKLINSLPVGIYYAQAYGTNTEGTFYGNTVMFSVVPTYNAVSLHNNDTIALLEFLDTHFGCSIRCVQDAPGIATGTTGTATDQDGNIYDTIVINQKRWMVQNLKTTHFLNGDPVPNITAPEAWAIDEIGAQCAYNNKPANV